MDVKKQNTPERKQKARRDTIPQEVHRRASIVARNLFQAPPQKR